MLTSFLTPPPPHSPADVGGLYLIHREKVGEERGKEGAVRDDGGGRVQSKDIDS